MSEWLTGEPAAQWVAALSPNPTVRRTALTYWARHLDELPGPLFFTLTQTELLRGEWQRVVNRSFARCKCGERRWFNPHDRRPFYETAPPQLFTLAPGGRHLTIAPYGGDVQAAIMQIHTVPDMLRFRLWPFEDMSPALREAHGMGVVDDLVYAGSDAIGVQQQRGNEHMHLTSIAEELSDKGAPLKIISGIERDSGSLLVIYPFAVYDVDLATSTIVVGVNRSFQVVDPSSRSGFHACS